MFDKLLLKLSVGMLFIKAVIAVNMYIGVKHFFLNDDNTLTTKGILIANIATIISTIITILGIIGGIITLVIGYLFWNNTNLTSIQEQFKTKNELLKAREQEIKQLQVQLRAGEQETIQLKAPLQKNNEKQKMAKQKLQISLVQNKVAEIEKWQNEIANLEEKNRLLNSSIDALLNMTPSL
jgi:septal ring factor EnvC (AmiA/AmiB activator)